MLNKRAQDDSSTEGFLARIALGVVALIIALGSIFILSGKMSSAIDFIKGLLGLR